MEDCLPGNRIALCGFSCFTQAVFLLFRKHPPFFRASSQFIRNIHRRFRLSIDFYPTEMWHVPCYALVMIFWADGTMPRFFLLETDAAHRTAENLALFLYDFHAGKVEALLPNEMMEKRIFALLVRDPAGDEVLYGKQRDPGAPGAGGAPHHLGLWHFHCI